MFNSVEVPAQDEWTMDFHDFQQTRLEMLGYSLKRLKQRKQLYQGPLAPPPVLVENRCDLCHREGNYLKQHPELEILNHYEDLRDKRQHDDYPCCKQRIAKLFRQYRIVSDCLPLFRIPFAHEAFLELQHMEEEIVNNTNLKALEDHNNYCQNVEPPCASEDTVDTSLPFDCFNPFNALSAVNPACISPKQTLGVPDDAPSVCVSPNDSSVPLIPDDPWSALLIPDGVTVPESGKGSDSGYTTPENSPVHGDSVQLESTLKTHIVFHRGPKIKGSIRKRRCVGSAVPAINLDHTGSNPKSVPSRVLAGRNSPKNRKSQAKDDPALAKKGPKKGKARRAPLSPEEERRKLERNKQKAIKEKQRRDKSKNLLDDVRAFLRHAFPAMLGQKSSHQRVIDTLIKLNPAVEFQEKWAKKNLLRVRRFLRQKKGSC